MLFPGAAEVAIRKFKVGRGSSRRLRASGEDQKNSPPLRSPHAIFIAEENNVFIAPDFSPGRRLPQSRNDPLFSGSPNLNLAHRRSRDVNAGLVVGFPAYDETPAGGDDKRGENHPGNELLIHEMTPELIRPSGLNMCCFLDKAAEYFIPTTIGEYGRAGSVVYTDSRRDMLRNFTVTIS